MKDDDDVRMIERAGGLRLLFEAKQTILVAGKCRGQNFDRDFATEFRIARAPHFAHAAFVDLGDNRVLSNRRVGGYWFAHLLMLILTL